MSFWKRKQKYPEEQLELHKTALELKGIAINLQRTADEFKVYVNKLKERRSEPVIYQDLIESEEDNNEHYE